MWPYQTMIRLRLNKVFDSSSQKSKYIDNINYSVGVITI